MSLLKAIGSGVAGAAAVTLLNESGRRVIPHAPRMDVIGKRGLIRTTQAMGLTPPRGGTLQGAALAGDVVSNSLYYSLIGVGNPRHAWQRGIALGVLAGLGAAILPPYLGLGRQPHRRGPWTQILTIFWYTLGGLAAAGAAEAIDEDD